MPARNFYKRPAVKRTLAPGKKITTKRNRVVTSKNVPVVKQS